MTSSPSYYDFLGVDPTAPPDEIRSAYLSLMKRHHPDLIEAEKNKRADDVAAFLNLCYDVLKDPHKRAQYDTYLSLEARDRARAVLRQRALLTGATYRTKSRRWDASSFAAAALALFIAATLLSLPWLQFRSGALPSEASARSPNYVEASVAPPVPQIGPLALRAQVDLAMKSRPEDALTTSQRCFQSARERSSLEGTELCILFDDAYVDWTRTQSAGTARLLYFSDEVLELRHKAALADIGLSEDSRLDELREMSLNALLQEVRAQVDESPVPDNAAEAASQAPNGPELSR